MVDDPIMERGICDPRPGARSPPDRKAVSTHPDTRTIHSRLIVVMSMALVFAGCAGQGSDTQDGFHDDADDAEEPPADETTTTASGKQVAVNKGIVSGRVHDDFNFSVQGALVNLVGTTHMTETDEAGQYVLDNMPTGTFDVRFEMTGFKAAELRVTIEAGREVRLDAQLDPAQARSGGFNPHQHNYWEGQDTRIIMDHDLSINEGLSDGSGTVGPVAAGPVAAAQCGTDRCRHEFTLPEQEDDKPATIWPGTEEMRVTFSWDDDTMVLARAALEVLDPISDSDGSIESEPIGNGDTITVSVAREQQDHGHALWTAWRFWLITINDAAGAEPGYVMGSVHVQIELVRGEVELDPPHQDYWAGTDQLAIGNWDWEYFPNAGVLPTQTSDADQHHVFAIQKCGGSNEADCVSIIPPETDRVEVRFEWLEGSTTGEKPPFSYSLTYRTANQHPGETPLDAYKEPVVLKEDLDAGWRLYEIELEPGEADAFYMQRSAWGFKWYQDHDLPVNVAQNQHKFLIQTTAFKGS